MAKGTLIQTEKVRGIEFKFYVNGVGHFYVDYDGDEVTNPTLEGLKKRLLDLTKQRTANLAIDFWRWEEADRWERKAGERGKLRHGIITGLHASNQNLLIKMDGEKAEQDSSYHGGGHGGHLKLTKDEQADFIKMKRQQENLEDQITAFVEAHKFDAKKAVREAAGTPAEEE